MCVCEREWQRERETDRQTDGQRPRKAQGVKKRKIEIKKYLKEIKKTQSKKNIPIDRKWKRNKKETDIACVSKKERMKERKNERMKERKNERKKERMKERKKERKNERKKERKNERKNERKKERKKERSTKTSSLKIEIILECYGKRKREIESVILC